jgi:adenosylmethionine-8-amino-7-oxononanoate aminotransferase
MTSALLKQNFNRDYATVTHGKGVFLFDDKGREYIDGSSGAMTANIGHGVAEIGEVMRKQAGEVAFTFRTQFTNEPSERLAKKLTSLAPGDLNWAFFANSGSEASEFAMRVALQYWREKGQPSKVKVLSRHVSYHGMTMGAVSMSGHESRRGDYGSLLHPFPVVPPAYAYRHAADGADLESYARDSIAAWEQAIDRQGVATVAAVIAEPIVGAAGGVLVPPPGYFRLLLELCQRLGVLLIMDEVITGLGRTGAWFASADEGIVPDIIIAAKGMSAGYTPMSAILMREHVVAAMRDGSASAPFGHTFSGNPLSSSICLAVIDYVERNGLLENARQRGDELRQGLESLSQRYPHMVDVRGRGLLWGFEFVLERATKEAPDPKHNAAQTFADICFEHGLVLYPSGVAPLNNAAMIAPPLVISADEIQELLRRLDLSLAQMQRRIESWS